MNCDPNSLISAASCYRCIPAGKQGAVLIYLLCQWASGPEDVYWFPETAVANWIDSDGPQVGDLAAFLAAPNHASTTDLTLSGVGLTILEGLQFIPLLGSLDCSGNPALTGLDLTGLTALSTLICSSCDITGTLDVSPCGASLTFVDCNTNPNLTALTMTGCTSLGTLICNFCDITGTLDVSPCGAALILLDCSININLTDLDLTASTGLVLLNCYSCDITGTLDVSPCGAALTYLDCNTNINLTALNVIANSNLQTLLGNDCGFTDMNLGGLLLLNSVSLQNNNIGSLGGFSVFGCVSLATLDVTSNPLLSSIVGDSGLSALSLLLCAGCDIDSLDVSGSASISLIHCSNNVIGSVGPLTLPVASLLYELLCDSNQIASINLTGTTALVTLDCNNNATLVSLLISPLSQDLAFVDGFGCAIPTGGAGGIDDIWNDVASAASILGVSGSIDFGGGTSGTLTGGVLNADWITLDGLGWTQTFNP